jgi:hypothetical protein
MTDLADNYSDKASNNELLEKAKNEFNREKRLMIKNLPSNTLEKVNNLSASLLKLFQPCSS